MSQTCDHHQDAFFGNVNLPVIPTATVSLKEL